MRLCFMKLCTATEKQFSLGNVSFWVSLYRNFFGFFQDFIDIAVIVIKFLGITDYINDIEPKSLLLLAD